MTISIACDSCRAPNAQGAKFCRQCGAPLAAAAPPQAVYACPGCGQQVAGTQKFCRGCGQPLAAAATQDMAARSAPTSAAAAQAATEASPAAARIPLPEQAGSTTRRVLPHPPEVAVRSSSKSAIPKTRRRKVWPWTVAGGLLAAIGLTAGLVYFGKLTLPTAAQRLVQDYVPVRAPEFHVGDASTYQLSFGDSDRNINEEDSISFKVTSIEENYVAFEYDASKIGPNKIAIDKDTFTYSRKPNEVKVEYGDGDDLVETVLLGVGLPGATQFGYDFPLRPGKTWQEKFSMTSKGQGGERKRDANLVISGQVLGWERNIGRLDGVMVDGLKLRIDVTTKFDKDGSSGFTWTTTRTQWYVPAARQSVVIRSFSHSNDTPRTLTLTQRLTNFIPTDITDTE